MHEKCMKMVHYKRKDVSFSTLKTNQYSLYSAQGHIGARNRHGKILEGFFLKDKIIHSVSLQILVNYCTLWTLAHWSACSLCCFGPV